MKSDVLITGGEGMLARALATQLPNARPFGRSQLDVTDPDMVLSVVRAVRPAVIHHCAAWTDVDGAESAADAAFAVNHEGTQAVVDAAALTGSRVVLYSTDYVFGGELSEHGEYAPADTVAPRSVYGRSKAAAEHVVLSAIREGRGSHLIVRTSWLYGRGGRNFVDTMAALGARNEALTVVDDQWGRPTLTDDLARAAISLAHSASPGIWHVAGQGVTTWCDFAREIVRLTHGRAVVEGVSSAEWGAAAPRPRRAVLGLGPTEAQLGHPLRHWREALRSYLAEAVPARGSS